MKLLDVVYEKLPDNIKTEVIIKSLVDQIKLLAWAMGGLNYLVGSDNKIFSLIFFIIPSWALCQYLALYLLTKVVNGAKL